MTEPRSNDRPSDRQSPSSETSPIPVVDTAPPLAPAEHGQSPWWSAPSGKPFGIPDFSHELRALLAAVLAWLFPSPQPIPMRVRARRRRR